MFGIVGHSSHPSLLGALRLVKLKEKQSKRVYNTACAVCLYGLCPSISEYLKTPEKSKHTAEMWLSRAGELEKKKSKIKFQDPTDATYTIHKNIWKVLVEILQIFFSFNFPEEYILEENLQLVTQMKKRQKLSYICTVLHCNVWKVTE